MTLSVLLLLILSLVLFHFLILPHAYGFHAIPNFDTLKIFFFSIYMKPEPVKKLNGRLDKLQAFFSDCVVTIDNSFKDGLEF